MNTIKKCLIISYSFPPINKISSRRYGEMAPYMMEFGWKPYILTTRSKGNLNVNISEEQIIRIGTHNEIKNTNYNNRGESKHFSKLIEKCYHTFLGGLQCFDLSVYEWFYKHRNSFLINAKKIQPEIIISTYGPAASLYIGSYISNKLNIPWLADFRDPGSIANVNNIISKKIDNYLDKKLLRNVSKIITVSPHLASVMAKYYNNNVDVIYNGFNNEYLFDKTMMNYRIRKEINKTIAYYSGSLYDHQIPALKLLIDAIACLENQVSIQLTLRLLNYSVYCDEIKQYAINKKVKEKIVLLKKADPNIVAKEQSEANLLLVFEDVNKSKPLSQGTVTGKLFEYLIYKAPIIAITRDDSDIKKILCDTSRGQVVSELHEIISMFKIIQDSKMSTSEYKFENIIFYSRKRQSQILCKHLDDLC